MGGWNFGKPQGNVKELPGETTTKNHISWQRQLAATLPSLPAELLAEPPAKPQLQANLQHNANPKGLKTRFPRWANKLYDFTGNLPIDSDQFMGYVGHGSQ